MILKDLVIVLLDVKLTNRTVSAPLQQPLIYAPFMEVMQTRHCSDLLAPIEFIETHHALYVSIVALVSQLFLLQYPERQSLDDCLRCSTVGLVVMVDLTLQNLILVKHVSHSGSDFLVIRLLLLLLRISTIWLLSSTHSGQMGIKLLLHILFFRLA
jgi:hypothetical protein